VEKSECVQGDIEFHKDILEAQNEQVVFPLLSLPIVTGIVDDGFIQPLKKVGNN
jgi:hypothetical protein